MTERVARVENSISDRLVEVAKKINNSYELPGSQRVVVLDEVTIEIVEALTLIRTLRSMVIV